MQVVAAAAPLLLWEGRADAINLDTMSVFGYGRESGTGRGGGGGLLSNPFGQTNKIKEQRPKPIRIPRTFLFLQFAVLLMRSCYNTVDDLDFFPMNQFQKDFFLLRQDEWEKYIKENDVKQGDLTNALYFDFISSAQFASITQSIQGAKQIFEETSGVENDKHVIQRDPMLKDDNLLAPRFFMRSGEKMYDGLLANFTDDSNYVKPPLPSSPNAPFSEVLKSFNSIYQIFQNNGYAMKIDVEDAGAASTQEYIQAKGVYEDWAKKIQDKVPATDQNWEGHGRKIVVRMQAPCTLWGRQWLSMQDNYLINDHDVMLATAFLRRSGRAVTVKTTMDQNSYTREFLLL